MIAVVVTVVVVAVAVVAVHFLVAVVVVPVLLLARLGIDPAVLRRGGLQTDGRRLVRRRRRATRLERRTRVGAVLGACAVIKPCVELSWVEPASIA
jgi:hypothetical protein